MKFFSLVAAFALPLGAAAAPTITFEGEGTAESPYLISTSTDLVKLSELTCTDNYADIYNGDISGMDGVYFLMTNDIDMTDVENFGGICVSDVSMVASRLRFQGVFDGGGHAIHNLKLNGVRWLVQPTETELGTPHSTNSREAYSFIGRLGSGGVVKNLSMARDCSFVGYKYVASIVGYAYTGSTIESCRNYATVTAYGQFAGGIVGYNEGADVFSCFNGGKIVGGASFVGGIAGSSLGPICGSANSGDVSVGKISNASASYSIVGGIAGMLNDTSTSDNLNVGTISGETEVGGIGGRFKALIRCLDYGMVFSADETAAGAIGGTTTATFGVTSSNCVYDSQLLPHGAVAGNPFQGVTAATVAELTNAQGVAQLGTANWEYANGLYPVLKTLSSEAALQEARKIVVNFNAKQSAADIQTATTLNQAEGLTWSLSDNSVFKIADGKLIPPSEKMEAPDTLIATTANVVKRIPIMYTGTGVIKYFEGEGTAESPYLLSTKEDLIKLGQLTSTNSASDAPSRKTFEEEYFKLVNDIDLEYTPEFKGISVSASFTLRDYVHFSGVIDGDGHSIHNMLIDGVRWTVSPDEVAEGQLPTVDNDASRNDGAYESFVGRLGRGGVIRNLSMASDCRIQGFSPVGGFIATMDDGSLVENCRNYADVTAFNTCVGGIAGIVEPGARITDCYNSGQIATGCIYAGGIAGDNRSVIERCCNTGDIYGLELTTNVPSGLGFMSNIGGIAGNETTSTASISNCLNTGSISGEEQCGGLLGSFGMGTNCLNYGVVRVDAAKIAKSGSLFGNKANMSGKIPSKLYFDNQINRVLAVSNETFTYTPEGGERELVTIGLNTSELINGKPLEGLSTELWQFTEGCYPILSQFAGEPRLEASRNIVALMMPGNNAAMLTLPVSLVPYAGVEWTADDHFKISDGSALPISDGVATITASALDGELTKTITCVIYGATPSSIESELVDESEVVSRRWFTVDGCRVDEPSGKDGRIYIVVNEMSDGSQRSVKVVN